MGVFDILPGFGGDGEATDAEPSDDSAGSDAGAADAADPAALTPADFRERADDLTGRSDVPTLDFTVESLDALDELAAGPSGAVDDQVAYGSYLGETIRREFGGEWVDEDGWHVAVELPADRTTIAVFDAAKMSIAKDPVFAKVAARLDAEGAARTPDPPESPEDHPTEEPPAEDPVDEVDVATADGTDAAPPEQVATDDVAANSEPLLGPGDDGGADGEADQSVGAAFDADEGADEVTDESDDEKAAESNAGPSAGTGVADEESGDDEDASDTLYETQVVEADHQGADEASADDRSEAAPESETESAADAQDGDAVDGDQHPSPGEGTAADGTPENEADPTDGDPDGSDLDAGDSNWSEPSRSDSDDSIQETGAETATGTDTDGAVDASGPHREDAGDLPFSGPGAADGSADQTDEEADELDGGSEDSGVATESDGAAGEDPGDDPDSSDRSAGEVTDSQSRAADSRTDQMDGPDADEGSTTAGVADAESPGDEQHSADPSAADSGTEGPASEDSTGLTRTDSRDLDGVGRTAGGTAGEDAAADATDEAVSDDAEDGADVDGDTDTDRPDSADASGEIAFDQIDDDAGADTVAADASDADTGVSDSDGDDPADDEDDWPVDDEDDEPVAPDRYVVREAAEAFADGWPDWDLDFTPESLPRLDAFVDDQWDGRFRASSLAERSVDHENSTDPLTQLGAYYGEVLVRWLDGEWVATDDGDGGVAVPDAGEKTERVDVFTLARDCLVAPSTFTYRYDALVNRLHVDKNTVSDGRPDVFDAGRESLTSGDVITQFAETAEVFAEQWEQYRLDYSPRSLRDLDEIVDALARDADYSEVALGEGSDPESLWLTARATATGAYFAAVLLRHRDAQWRIGTDVELVMDRPDGERTVDPAATAADCLRGDGSFTETYAALGE